MQVLASTFDLVTDAAKLNFGAFLESSLDGNIQDLVRLDSLASLIKRLALDLHLFLDAVVKLFQRHRQGPLDG